MGRILCHSSQIRQQQLPAASSNWNISSLFKAQAAAHPSALADKMVQARHKAYFSEESLSASKEQVRDMTAIAADIKNTFSTAITDLIADLLVLTEKLATAEKAGKHRDKNIQRLVHTTDSHTNHLIETNRQIEDLVSRSRRNNIRVRGVPESV